MTDARTLLSLLREKDESPISPYNFVRLEKDPCGHRDAWGFHFLRACITDVQKQPNVARGLSPILRVASAAANYPVGTGLPASRSPGSGMELPSLNSSNKRAAASRWTSYAKRSHCDLARDGEPNSMRNCTGAISLEVGRKKQILCQDQNTRLDLKRSPTSSFPVSK